MAAQSTASVSHSSAQVIPGNTTANASRVPTRSRSLSNTVSKRPASIFHSRASATGWSNYWKPQVDDVPHLTRTPWEVERYKKNSTWRRSGPDKEFPSHIFKNLPREIYECIVGHLERIHLQHDQACPSCYLRDLCSLSLTSRAWDRAATLQMYSKAHVVGLEAHPATTKSKVTVPSRLRLLRRTLRERPSMARLVHELHLPDFQTLYQHASIERERIVDLVASLVMACPFLEGLVGFHIPFTRSFDRLSYALATRSNLRERVWLFAEPEDDYVDDEDDGTFNDYYFAACDPTERFLSLNTDHTLLTTLVLHRYSGEYSPALNFRAIIGTLRQLPSLQHLSVSGLPATSFTNLMLNSLPSRLVSLRLENLPGINDKGLQRFLTSHLSISIERLTLINLELSSLLTISLILSEHLANLKKFTVAQFRTPDLGPRTSVPDFISPALQFLHFEFRSQAGPAMDPFSLDPRKSVEFPFSNPEPISCLATSLLASKIEEGAFPALRRVRVPFDPQGLMQARCRPRATALLPSDTTVFARPVQKSGAHCYGFLLDEQLSNHCSFDTDESSYTMTPSPRADSAIDSPTFDTTSTSSALLPSKTRLAAQARILAARKVPLMVVRVYDPEGELCINSTTGGFIGDLKSNIVYEVKPDGSRWPGNRDQSGPPQPEWTAGIEDLADERTAPNDRLHRSYWGSCGHRLGGRTGVNAMRVDELF
jgi:hypothetical protein